MSFKYGGTVFPLTAGGETNLLAVCDPSLAKLQDYLAFTIDLYLGTALVDAVAPVRAPIAMNVRKLLSVDPIACVSKADQLGWPLFAIWRKSSKVDNKTTNWRQNVATVGWGFMLPAMTLEQGMKYAHVLHAVELIVDHALNEGHDPAYNDDERIVGGNYIERAFHKSAVYEPYKVGDNTDAHFHSVFGELEVAEKSNAYAAGLPTLVFSTILISDESVEPGNPISMIDARINTSNSGT